MAYDSGTTTTKPDIEQNNRRSQLNRIETRLQASSNGDLRACHTTIGVFFGLQRFMLVDSLSMSLPAMLGSTSESLKLKGSASHSSAMKKYYDADPFGFRD